MITDMEDAKLGRLIKSLVQVIGALGEIVPTCPVGPIPPALTPARRPGPRQAPAKPKTEPAKIVRERSRNGGPTSKVLQVVKFIAEHGPSSPAKISNGTGIPVSSLHTQLESELIVREGFGNYGITNEARQMVMEGAK